MPGRGGRDGEPGEGGEVAVGADVAGDGVDPDLTGDLPGVATQGGGHDVEGLVGDAGVDVHAAVVVGGVDVAAHVGRLGVLAQAGVVVGGAGRGHRAQGHAVDPGSEQLGADQPVGLVGALAQGALLDEHAEDVGDGLVERPGLVLVVQAGGVLGDPVRELVPDDVDAAGEGQEDDAVTVAEDHLGAVPEGVVVVGAEVHAGHEGQALAVEGVAAVDLLPELPGGTEPVVGLGDALVAGGRLTLGAHQGARQGGAVLRVVDGAHRPGRGARRQPGTRGARSVGAQPSGAPTRPQLGLDVEGGLGLGGQQGVVGRGEVLEHVRRHDRAVRRRRRRGRQRQVG